MFDWITGLIDAGGLFGVAALMFLENLFPPIPSELIMPLAGFNAANGSMNLVAVIVAGSLGSLLGAYFWYWIGQKVGMARLKRLAASHGRWLTVTPDELESARDWFNRHGAAAVLFGRLVPTIRTFISVPAGVAPMPLGKFLLYSALGTAVWTAFLTLLGYVLQSQYDKVEQYMNPISTAVVIGLVAFYLWRVATYGKRVRAKQDGGD
ncbi:DedA family protein [Brevirhabdus sp.]|uniref:DedA family protein n=1 Tax=Brevirhabdus sp. TaxID=2004514 RepID=UPI0040582339